MTEFEAATVAYQNAALALQQSQVWAAIAIPLVSGLVGAGQIAVVAIGIRVMRRTSDQREKREDARHREAMAAIDARHREAMRALDGQAEAFRSQGEALRFQGESLRSQGETLGSLVKGLDRQTEALKVVIERTAPRP